jgi:hypothetical protein
MVQLLRFSLDSNGYSNLWVRVAVPALVSRRTDQQTAIHGTHTMHNGQQRVGSTRCSNMSSTRREANSPERSRRDKRGYR